MTWTTPGTAVPGQVLTSTFWNAEVRDRFDIVRSYQNRYARAKLAGASSLTNNTTTWADFDNSLDLVLAASTGDVIEVAISGRWQSDATLGYLDVVSVVSGSPVNSFGLDGAPSNSHGGITGWEGEGGVIMPISGSFFRTLVAGDISSGNVTLRLRRRNASASNKTIFTLTNTPFEWWARNHGPVTT
jgi:hypothetical protein